MYCVLIVRLVFRCGFGVVSCSRALCVFGSGFLGLLGFAWLFA